MKELSIFIDESGDFGEYDYHSPYYIISMVMHNQDYDITPELIKLDNVEFRKVMPADYRLFQVADLVCTLQLLELKLERHILSNSEKLFFENERTLKKNYLKPLAQKMM